MLPGWHPVCPLSVATTNAQLVASINLLVLFCSVQRVVRLVSNKVSLDSLGFWYAVTQVGGTSFTIPKKNP